MSHCLLITSLGKQSYYLTIQVIVGEVCRRSIALLLIKLSLAGLLLLLQVTALHSIFYL